MGRDQRGQSIVEVLLAVAVLGIGGFAVMDMTLQAFGSVRVGNEHMQAAAFATEGWEAAASIRNNAWNSLALGTHGVTDGGGTWAFSGASDTFGDYVRTVEVAAVQRDGSGNIVTSGGTNDVHTRRVTSSVTWPVTTGRQGTISQTHYLTNWNSLDWFEDTTAEFSDGAFSSTDPYTSPDSDGAIGLEQTASAYWACGQIEGFVDKTSTSDVNDVYSFGTYAYYVTAVTSGAGEFYVVDISDPSAPTIVGSVELGATAYGVWVDGSYAYVASDANAAELTIINISTPSAPTITGTLNIGGNQDAYDVVASGSRAYVVRANDAGGAEFFVVNVGTPATPAVIGSVDLGNNSRGVQLSGSYAYVVTDTTTQEFRVVDLAVETAPTVAATVNLAGAATGNDLAVSGSFAYVVTANDASSNEFYAINITTPTAPTVSGSVDLGQGGNAVTMEGTAAYVAASTAGATMLLVDAATPTAPVLSATWGVSDASYLGAFWNGSRLLVASSADNADFQVLRRNLTTGWGCAERKNAGDIAGSATAGNAVYVVGTILYAVKTDSTGADFFIYDVSSPTTPSLVGSLDLGATGYDVVVSGNYAYVASSSNTQELIVIDITTPATPTIVGSYNASGTTDAFAVAVNGTKVLLGQGSTFYEINVATPASPALLGSVGLGGTVYRIEPYNATYAFTATGNTAAEMRVVNFSAATPTIAASYNAPGATSGRGLWIKGTQLLLVTSNDAAGAEFFNLNVSTPTSPTLSGSLNLGVDSFAVAADTDENYAFAGANLGQTTLRLIDTSVASSPDQIAIVDRLSGFVNDAFFANDTFYFATAATDAEFPIFGKPTQGGGGGGGYATSGTYISSIFDTTDTANWNAIQWTESVVGCATGDIQLQIRTAPTSGGLASELWQGPEGEDGDATDFFTDPTGAILHATHNGDRYVQYQITMTGDGTCTQQLTDIALNYSTY